MNKKILYSASTHPNNMDLTAAVEEFIACGGVIDIVPDGKLAKPPSEPPPGPMALSGTDKEKTTQLELLKDLVAKGAGISALQYTLKMNRRDIRRLAIENGVKISGYRPIHGERSEVDHGTDDIDDAVAGHAMHYASLGYTTPEIAQMLELSVRQVWKLGQEYRFELKQKRADDPSEK